MGQAIVIAVAAAGVWWVGHETVGGIKKLDHFIAHKFHHSQPSQAVQPQTENNKK
jgi:hypothetical protein